MKTLHEIRSEPTFLGWMQLRFADIHADWHYRGDQVWYRASLHEDAEPILLPPELVRMWHGHYARWLEAGAPPDDLDPLF